MTMFLAVTLAGVVDVHDFLEEAFRVKAEIILR